jgi:hypothetical protein
VKAEKVANSLLKVVSCLQRHKHYYKSREAETKQDTPQSRDVTVGTKETTQFLNKGRHFARQEGSTSMMHSSLCLFSTCSSIMLDFALETSRWRQDS